MLLHPISMLKAADAGGGASGNFTFSITQFEAVVATGSDPAVRTLNTSITEGNAIFAITFERSGGDPANHAVSDTSSGSWTRLSSLDVNNAVGGNEANTNLTVAIHWRLVTGSEGDVTPTISFDDGTSNSKGLAIFEIQPSAAYNWTFDAGSATGTGASDWNGAGSGNASPSGDDIFELAYAAARNSTSPPTAASFSAHTSDVDAAYGSSNQFSVHIGIISPSTAAGTKSATNASNGSGNEGVVGIACFKDG